MKSLIRQMRNSTPIPYSSANGGQPNIFRTGSARSDPKANMEAYGGVGTLFSVVSRTANATAQVDWKLYRSSPDGNKDNRVEVTRHLALQIWNKPNKFTTQHELVEGVQQHVDLTGEGWMVMERAPGSSIPLGMWPVRPDRMQPIPSATDFLAGYIYTGPNNEKVPLGIDDVIMLRMPNPLDPYRGLGPVQSLLTDLDAVRFSAAWNRNFFLNSAEPGGIIEVPTHMSDDEFNEMTRRWNEQHRGVSKAHRVAVLEQGKWVSNAFSQRDMQFVELRSVSRDTILEAFGMPKSTLGITEDVNRASAEAGEVVFGRWLQIPRLDRWKQALNNDFLPLFGKAGQGLEFDYVDPIPVDQMTENETLKVASMAAKLLVEAGFDPAETLAAIGLPPITWVGPPKALTAPADNADPGLGAML